MLDKIVHLVATGFEITGATVIVLVSLSATIRFVRAAMTAVDWIAVLPLYRADISRGVLLGLELLIAADIVGTVAVEPGFASLGVLALVIFIRTFLSISLGVEIEGFWPWRRRDIEMRAAKHDDGSPAPSSAPRLDGQV